MTYVNGDGIEKPIEILTKDGVRALTGHEGEIPRAIPHALEIDGYGKTFRVEDVLNQWPGELPDDNEIDRRLWTLRKERISSLATPSNISYLILHKRDDD